MALIPDPSPFAAPYWEGARRGELLLQRCDACGEAWHPPMPSCPHCRSSAVSWVPASGRGIVYSYTIARHPAHPDFADRIPYVAAIVELEEGPRMVANVIGCDVEDVAIDMPVAVTFVPVTDDVTLPQFAPDPARG